jgi:hypothetical protein
MNSYNSAPCLINHSWNYQHSVHCLTDDTRVYQHSTPWLTFDTGPINIHCKKRFAIFPSLARMSLTKLSLAGNNLVIPVQSLVSDIPAGDGKIYNLFLQCTASCPLLSHGPINILILVSLMTYGPVNIKQIQLRRFKCHTLQFKSPTDKLTF